ncbi:acyltransferase family protein [Nocardioides sp. GCM10028917]|uniref:acyltransferase family protein n=1 Tax=Nocardioides sp. GCM10028917 TaxID=3273408 RepID=UPI003615E909
MSAEPTTEAVAAASAVETARVVPALDSVRAVGALMVLVTHVAFWTGSYDFDLWGTFLSRLDSGVALFFVLSGFLLSRPFILRRRIDRPAPSLRGYLWKRAVRVLPVYWIVAVLALVFVEKNADAGPTEWLRAMTLTDIYVADMVPAGITQTWSLATEVAFYVALPALMFVWSRATGGRRSDAAVVALTGLALVVSVLWIVEVSPSLANAAPLHHQWLPTFLLWFAIGIALAHVHVHHVEHPADDDGRDLLGWIPVLGRQPGVSLVIAAAVLLVASTPIVGPPVLLPATDLQIATKAVLYAVLGGLVVLAALYAPANGAFARVLSHPALRHLGHISYGVFCVHVLVLHLVTYVLGWEQFAGGFLRHLCVTLAVSLVLAEILYRLVERPLSRLKPRGATSAEPSSASGTTSRS